MTRPALRLRHTIALAAMGSALIAGCGGDDESAEAEESATPAEAITEIAAVRSCLEDALAAYEKGDADEAEQLAGDAYLEHFEIVEGPLEEQDEELNEELEELIREELRTAITSGEPKAQVQALVDEANDGLDQAETALEQAG